MLIAQGLGEYGALSGGASSGLASLMDNVDSAIRDASPTTWTAVLAGVFIVWFFFFRAR